MTWISTVRIRDPRGHKFAQGSQDESIVRGTSGSPSPLDSSFQLFKHSILNNRIDNQHQSRNDTTPKRANPLRFHNIQHNPDKPGGSLRNFLGSLRRRKISEPFMFFLIDVFTSGL